MRGIPLIYIFREFPCAVIVRGYHNMTTAGKELKRLRERSNLNPDELALLCGWPSSVRVKRYEEGLKIISLEDAISLSSVLGVVPARFLSDSAGDAEYVRYKSTSLPIVGETDLRAITLNEFVLTAEGAWSNYIRSGTIPYRLYGLKVNTAEEKPFYNQGDLLIIDSKSHPCTGDLVVVKSYFEEYKIQRFRGYENGKFKLCDFSSDTKNESYSDSDIFFVMGVMVSCNDYMPETSMPG